MVKRHLIGLLDQLLEWASEGYQTWEAKQFETLRATIDVALKEISNSTDSYD